MRTTLLGLAFVIACGGSGRTNPEPEPDAQEPADATIAGDGPPGAACGGFSARPCAANEYCDFPLNTCGVADETGTCKRRPDACPLIDPTGEDRPPFGGPAGAAVEVPTPRDSTSSIVGRPVCACDLKVHPSDCLAFSDGFDLNANGSCDVPAGNFACGYAVCNLQTQYCRHEVKPPAADLYSCLALPPACTTATPACGCLRDQPCGTACTGDARVGLTLLCQ
jgi:hypothetical protein